MQPYEKLGLFYLGREYDLEAQKATPTPVLYDSRDLVTHAAIVGMTGIHRAIYIAVTHFSGRRLPTFATLDEAKDWLVAQ